MDRSDVSGVGQAREGSEVETHLRVRDRPHRDPKIIKIFSKSWHIFQRRKTPSNSPRFHHKTTTTSPQITSTKTPLSPKPPSKTTAKPPLCNRDHANIFF